MIPCIKAWSAANPFVLSCCFQIIPVNVFLTPKKLVLVIFNGNTWLEIGSTWRRLFKMTNQLFFSEFWLRNAVTSRELVLNKAKIKMAKWNEIFAMFTFYFILPLPLSGVVRIDNGASLWTRQLLTNMLPC